MTSSTICWLITVAIKWTELHLSIRRHKPIGALLLTLVNGHHTQLIHQPNTRIEYLLEVFHPQIIKV
jgi:hypothetical protein